MRRTDLSTQRAPTLARFRAEYPGLNVERLPVVGNDSGVALTAAAAQTAVGDHGADHELASAPAITGWRPLVDAEAALVTGLDRRVGGPGPAGF